MRPIPVLLNSGGGKLASDPSIATRVRDALAKAKLDGELELINGSQCKARFEEVAKRKDPLVIVGGGDGTISGAAAAFAGTGTLVGILALGTLNHFARDLQIPEDIDEAARLIAQPTEHQVDVGQMNDHLFINNSAIGVYPLMVVDRDMQRSRFGRSKRAAMIIASLRTLLRFKHHRLFLTINEERTARVDTPLLFVGNNSYRIDVGAPGTRGSIEEGELCVFVMRKKTRRGLVGASLRALFNRSRPDDMVRLEGVERLRVATTAPHIMVSLDGEVIRAKAPLDYTIRKKALRVIAPEVSPKD